MLGGIKESRTFYHDFASAILGQIKSPKLWCQTCTSRVFLLEYHGRQSVADTALPLRSSMHLTEVLGAWVSSTPTTSSGGMEVCVASAHSQLGGECSGNRPYLGNVSVSVGSGIPSD